MKKYNGNNNCNKSDKKIKYVEYCNRNRNSPVPERDDDTILAVKNLSISENENQSACHQPLDQIMKKRKISWPGPSGTTMPEPDSHLSEITQEQNRVMDKPGKVKMKIR